MPSEKCGLGGSRTHKSDGHDILSVERLPVSPLALFPAVESAVSRLKTVTVRAENPKVLDSIVQRISVHVVQLERHSPVRCAICPAAELAPIPLESCPDQSSPQLARLVPAPSDEDRVQGKCGSAVSPSALVPSSSKKVTRRDLMSDESGLNLPVIPSSGNQPQRHQDLPNAR